jgi:hypothetical protein
MNMYEVTLMKATVAASREKQDTTTPGDAEWTSGRN